MPWRKARQDVIDSVFAANLPTDPVRAVAYTTAASLLGKVPDDASPVDRLTYANLSLSGLDKMPAEVGVEATGCGGLRGGAGDCVGHGDMGGDGSDGIRRVRDGRCFFSHHNQRLGSLGYGTSEVLAAALVTG